EFVRTDGAKAPPKTVQNRVSFGGTAPILLAWSRLWLDAQEGRLRFATYATYTCQIGRARNRHMAVYASANQPRDRGGVIAVWDGEGRGTASMIRLAQEYGLWVYVHTVPAPEVSLQDVAEKSSRYGS